MTNRNSTVDITKGIGIILVVLGHNSMVLHEPGVLFRVIFSFHMPLFFFLSGIFLKESSQFNKFIISRVDSLLKPYFVILTTLGVINLLAGVATTGTVYPAHFRYFAGMLYGTGSTIAWDAWDWMPLWFLPHLFLSSAFALLILKSLHSSRVCLVYLVVVILLVLDVCFLGYRWRQGPIRLGSLEILPWIGLPWSLDLLPITSAFVIVGSLLSRHIQLMNFNSAGLLISVSIFFCLHYFFNETIDLNLRIYGSFFISTLQAILGIYICLNLSCFLKRYVAFQRPLTYVASETLSILIFHLYFQGHAFLVLSKLIDKPLFDGVGSLIVGIVLPLALWKIIKRNSVLAKMLLPQKYNPLHASIAPS